MGLGFKCIYYRGTCVNDASACASIPTVGATTSDKKSYCENTAAAETCTYIAGNFCLKVAATCVVFDVTDSTDNAETCASLKDSSSN